MYLLILLLSVATLAKAAVAPMNEEFEKIVYAAGNKTLTPESFRLALCVAATNLQMEIAKDFLSKLYTGKEGEKRKAKLALTTIQQCLHKLPVLNTIPENPRTIVGSFDPRYAAIPFDQLANPHFKWEITDEERAINQKVEDLALLLNPPVHTMVGRIIKFLFPTIKAKLIGIAVGMGLLFILCVAYPWFVKKPEYVKLQRKQE